MKILLLAICMLVCMPWTIAQNVDNSFQIFLDDSNTLYSWGNGNGIVESFEVVCIHGSMMGLKETEELDVELPKEVNLVYRIQTTRDEAEPSKVNFRFSFMATGEYNKTELPIVLYQKDALGNTLASYTWEAVF